MSTHERDIFMWRWTRDRKGGRAPLILRDAGLGAVVGAIFGLMWNSRDHISFPSTVFIVLMLASIAASTLFIAIIRYLSPRRAEILYWSALALAAVLGAPLLLAAAGISVAHPVVVGGCVALGAFMGAVISLRVFQHNEDKYLAYLEIDASIPARRPWPAPGDVKGFGLLVLLILAAVGPVMIIALLQP